jgi:hypothetical protein
MSSGNLSCPDCRIRVRARAPEIALLEGRCPICGATLEVVSSASSLIGFRSFDLDELSGQDGSGPPPSPPEPVDLLARREASARDQVSAEAWPDAGNSVGSRALAQRLPAP